MTTRVGLLIIPIVCMLSACYGPPNTVRGSGRVVSETREVRGIAGVTLATIGDLTIEVGGSEAFSIEAEDNLLGYFETEVRGGMLTIQTRSNTSINTTRPVRYRLTVNGLNSIAVTSSGSIEAPALQAGSFSVKISSSGDVALAGLDADSLAVTLSSSGDLTIGGGQVGQQIITTSSSGSYLAADLRSQSADVKCSSSGNAVLWVTDNVTAVLSSSGNVSYYGSPKVTSRETSSGRVKALGER